jgi:DNA helicase-2/ATP-dependent DNA helicase PcrA
VVNTPTRGIGERTVQQIRDCARDLRLSLWDAARHLLDTAQLAARAGGAVRGFMDRVETLAHSTAGLPLHETIEHMLNHSGLLEHYRNEKSEKAQSRVENLEELITAARHFQLGDEEEMDALSAFLTHAALEAGETQGGAWDDCVQLMTLHSAKGLEFPLVFLVGVEEGLFPHQMSVEEPGRLEEERRLCYVGMTRAMKALYVTHAEVRRLYGQETYPRPSRFIGEIPTDLLQEVRIRGTVARPVYAPAASTPNPAGMRLGQRVRHGKFGEGVVLKFEGQGESARVQVNFSDAGTKWLVLSFANLQSV